MSMQNILFHIVRGVEDIGSLIRLARKNQGFSINNTAPLVNLSTKFISEVERGKDTAELGKVLKLLDGVGLTLVAVPKPYAKQIEQYVQEKYGPKSPL